MIMYFVTDFNVKDADLFRKAGSEDILVSFWILQNGKTSNAKIVDFYDHIHGLKPPEVELQTLEQQYTNTAEKNDEGQGT